MSDLLSRLDDFEADYRDVPICLKKKLIEARDAAVKAVAAAEVRQAAERRADAERLASAPQRDSSAVVDAKEHLASLNAQIAAASITLRIREVPRETYNRWMLQCPPRKGKQEAFDPTRFYIHAARNSGVYVDRSGEEHPISEEEWDRIDKNLSDGEYDRIAQAVLAVNRESGRVNVAPFVNASETTVDSFGISASRAPSGSRRAGSGAGSRPKSTSKKSTAKGDAPSE